MSSAVFARWTRFFVQSPVARMGVCATEAEAETEADAEAEDEAWADAVVVAISICSKSVGGGFWGRCPLSPETASAFLNSSHAFQPPDWPPTELYQPSVRLLPTLSGLSSSVLFSNFSQHPLRAILLSPHATQGPALDFYWPPRASAIHIRLALDRRGNRQQCT